MSVIHVKSIIHPDKKYSYVDDGNPKQGGVKDVYFSPKRDYVVAFFRDQLDFNQKERIKKIVTLYLGNIKKGNSADYFLEEIFRWPYDAVEKDGKTGVIVPIYKSQFFFKKGYATLDTIKDSEKVGKWFTSPSFRNSQYPLALDNSELGNWLSYFQIAINICRGVKKMHQMGLAHSDLSYNNVLIDPVTKSATIIDLDGLVVPGLFPPEVIGTADFIAPEVLSTKHLNVNDPNRVLPNQKTDLHALAVLIYMYLLRRHPLRGGKIWDTDAERDEILAMGEKAIFIENKKNSENKVKIDQLRKWDSFWGDTTKVPYTILGPYLTALFDRAFIDGLHNPISRPIANEWETALLKTVDLIQPCSNPSCNEKWYVFDNSKHPKCPFCDTSHIGPLPMADIYYRFKEDVWKSENHRLMIYHNQYLFKWHVSREIVRNETLSEKDKQPVGYFSFYQNKWFLVNTGVKGMRDLTNNRNIPIKSMVELSQGTKVLLSNENGGRLLNITITNI